MFIQWEGATLAITLSTLRSHLQQASNSIPCCKKILLPSGTTAPALPAALSPRHTSLSPPLVGNEATEVNDLPEVSPRVICDQGVRSPCSQASCPWDGLLGSSPCSVLHGTASPEHSQAASISGCILLLPSVFPRNSLDKDGDV